MQSKGSFLYRFARGLLRLALGFYFSRIARFHRERVPSTGPLLFTSNHPNSVTDAFVIGTSVPRKVNFVATVQLFQLEPVRWLLTQVGVIPINRMKDNPRAMRTVMDSFEACFQVLEQGEAIGIFPEGVTHDDPQLKTVKTGAARMALELENRHGGKLGMNIVPVGLNFSAKDLYRSEALIHFGEPIRVAEFLQSYTQNKHVGIQALNAEIEHRIQALILHVPRLERVRVVRAVRRLYQERLQVAHHVLRHPVPRQLEELTLTQTIADAVNYAFEHHPERAAAFVNNLNQYERWLQRLHLSDEVLAHFPQRKQLLWQSAAWTLLALAGAPFAVYGWVHRYLPIRFVEWAVERYGEVQQRRASVSTAAILSGTIGFVFFYSLCAAVFYAFFGWPATLFYALSLPITGLVAHYYTRELKRFAASLRATWVLLRAPLVTKRLLTWRSQLIAEIEEEQTAINKATPP